MSTSPSIPIIYNFNDQDIEIIENDLLLYYAGCKIIYFVDPFDVIEFALPRLFDANQNNIFDEDTASQQYLAYDYFFLKHTSAPIVTEEYRQELRSLFSDLKKETRRYSRLGNKDEFLKYFLNLSKSPKQFERKISIFLIYSIGFLDVNVVDRLKQLLGNLGLDNPKNYAAEDKIILEDIISDTRPTNRVDYVFEMFCYREQPRMSKLSSDKRDIYLENTYRDIEVIDRIFEINRKVRLNNILKNKYVFQYLSSSTYKSPILIELFLATDEFVNQHSLKEFKILRNINHFTVLDSVQKRSEGITTAMTEINSFKMISSFCDERNLITKSFSPAYKKISQKLEMSISLNRDSLENTYTLYKLLSSYKEKTAKAIKELQLGSEEGLKDMISHLYSLLSVNRNEKEKVQIALENYRDEHMVQNKMLKLMSSLEGLRKLHKVNITVYAGRDVIRSHIQLYPVLLFYKELSIKGANLLSDLLLHVASPVSHEKEFIIKKYTQIHDYEYFTLNNFERKIFSLLLQLVLPTSTEETIVKGAHHMTSERFDKEKKIVDNLVKIYKINEKRSISFKPVKGEGDNIRRLEVFFCAPKTIKCEITYFLSWMYRRIGMYYECFMCLHECISVSSDPRLYHSRALCTISEVYADKLLTKEQCIIKLSEAILDLQQSKEMFAVENSNETLILSHILIGIDNTICDAYVQLFLLDEEHFEDAITSKARILLDSFKNKLLQLGEKYENYPTYNHTEVDLEYCEAIILEKKGFRNEAIIKIGYAYKRVHYIDQTKLLQDFPYLIDSAKRIEKFAKRINKS